MHDELVATFPPSSSPEDIPPFFTGAPISSSPDTKYSQFAQTINSLPYLDAVLKETLRLYSAVTVTLPRVIPTNSSQGKLIDGIYLPSGTVVGSFAYGIHRDQSIFGSDSFEPERWLPDRSPEKKNNKKDWSEVKIGEGVCHDDTLTNPAAVEIERVKDMEKRLWAFSSGSRVCAGRQLSQRPHKFMPYILTLLVRDSLAVFQMKMLLATIFWRYKTVVVGDKEAETFGKLGHK